MRIPNDEGVIQLQPIRSGQNVSLIANYVSLIVARSFTSIIVSKSGDVYIV